MNNRAKYDREHLKTPKEFLEKEFENRIKSLEPYFESLDNYCTEKIMSLCDGTKVKSSLDIVDITDCIIDVARHFYELGLNSRKED